MRAPRPARRWAARLGWLLVLWMAGVAALGAVAWLLGALLRALGLHEA